MSCTCCRCLFFLCHLLPSYQRVRFKGKVGKHHESTQMLLRWEKTMVKLHIQAWSPVLAQKGSQHSARGTCFPEPRSDPCLVAGWASEALGSGPRRWKVCFMKASKADRLLDHVQCWEPCLTLCWSQIGHPELPCLLGESLSLCRHSEQ